MGEKMTLLPCPFCGMHPTLTAGKKECYCHHQGCPLFRMCMFIEEWNTRATPAQTVDVDRKSWIDGWMAGFISTMPPLSAIKTVDLQRHAEKAWSDKLSQAIGDKT